MAFGDILRSYVTQLLGISAYEPAPPSAGPKLDDPQVIEQREALGGNITPLVQTRLRWYLRDLESAQAMADSGYLTSAAQIYRAMRRDGVLFGLLTTRASGLVRLPRTFDGHAEGVAELKSQNGSRSVFDEMFPPAELDLMVQDGIMLKIAVAEMRPVPGRAHPVMIRLEPEFLHYRWNEGRWYFRSSVGLIPITPGDGRWILHMPGGRMSPWQFGAWIPCGEAWINKIHAKLARANYGSNLANPARVLTAPLGATEPQRVGMLTKLAAWGYNAVFELPVGWDAKLLETTGRGQDVWRQDEESSNRDIRMALAGQEVTSDGGSGFINGDLFKSIRADLIQSDGDELSHTISTQVLPAWLLQRFGEAAMLEGVTVRWDTKTPQDRQREATTLVTASDAITKLSAAVAGRGVEVDMAETAARFGLPVKPVEATSSEKIALDLAPTDLAKVVRAKEARASRGLPPFGDERDDKTIPELEAAGQAEGQAVVEDPKLQVVAQSPKIAEAS